MVWFMALPYGVIAQYTNGPKVKVKPVAPRKRRKARRKAARIALLYRLPEGL